MLRRLTVENFVLIDRLDLELDGGLNIITGETGAGKSILLGALSLLLGSRSESGAIKSEDRNCVIEGTFEMEGENFEKFFAQNDLDFQSPATIRRVISPAGKSRAYVNDLPVPLSVLKELGALLIDIHSQHQSLMLASDAFRCAILDSVANNGEWLGRYRIAYEAWKRADVLLAEMKDTAAKSARDEEYLRFQSDQLRQAALNEGEQEELEQHQAELSHAEQICQALGEAVALLDQDEHSVLPRLKAATQAIGHIEAYYPRAAEFHARLASAMLELRDVERDMAAVAESVDADPAQLMKIEQRLDLIYTLQRKHDVRSLGELIALGEDYANRLEAITSSSERVEEAEKQAMRLRADAAKFAVELSARRAKAAVEVKRHVEQLLERLGMPGAKLTVEVVAGEELRSTGSDSVRFLFSANRNSAPQPVEKVASGGEISRLMLTLKSLVAQRSLLPTVIFDEIDAGVSGRIADAMGEIISDTASRMQVVNITHLPQIASKSATHFVVYKEETPSGAVSRIRKLTPDERVEEIAKMLSGSKITETALAQARQLLGIS